MVGELASLRMISLTWRPSIPPWLLTTLCHSWYPRWNATPSAEKSPVSDSDAPIRIGGLEPAVLPDALLDGLLLPQAASTAAVSAATAVTRQEPGAYDMSSPVPPSELVHNPANASGRAARLAGRPPQSPADQLPQWGFGLMIFTAPDEPSGSTWTYLPFCHWKMNAAASGFSPSALNFTGPCTVASVTPLCR